MVGQVDGIAVAEAGAVEQGAVVVQCGRAPYHLVASVAVDIGHRHIVVAVCKHGAAATASGRLDVAVVLLRALAVGIIGGHRVGRAVAVLTEPAWDEMLSVETDGPDEGITIIASAENAAGRSVGPVDIAHAGQVAVAAVVAVGVGLADGPVEGACCLAQCRGSIAVGVVGDGVDGLAGLSVEHRQVFMSAVHASAAGNPRLGVVGSLDGGVVGGLVDIIALAVFRTGGCLAHHLGLAVAVEVIDHILCIVGTGTDVLPQVYAPEQLRRAIASGTVAPVHLVAVDDDIARDTVLRVVFRVGRIPFQEQFILSVAVHIAYAHVVGTVGVGSAAGAAAGRPVQL